MQVGGSWKRMENKTISSNCSRGTDTLKPNVTIIYQQSDFDKWLSDFISHFFDFIADGDFVGRAF